MNENYHIKREESKLELKIAFTPIINFITSIILALLFGSMIVPLLILTIYASNPHDLQEISYFLFFIGTTIFLFIISLYFPYLYFRDKNREDIFSFDKRENLLLFKRQSAYYKEVGLNDVEKINHYSISLRGHFYYLSLILKDNQKIKIISQTESKSDILHIGEMISDFLQIPFENKGERSYISLIMIVSIFGLLIYFGIFLPLYFGTEIGRVIAILMIITFSLTTIIGLALFKIFKKRKAKIYEY